MPLPPKSAFTLAEVAEAWSTTPRDLVQYALEGNLELRIYVLSRRVNTGWWEPDSDDTWCSVPTGVEPVNGLEPVLGKDLWPLLGKGVTRIKDLKAPEEYHFRTLCGSAIEITLQELFVTAEERRRFEHAYGIEPAAPEPEEFTHEPGYGLVTWRGRRFELGEKQASVIAQLHAAYLRGEPWLGETQLLAEAGSASKRLVDLFKTQDGWRELITRLNGRARLALPDRNPAGVGTKRAFRRAMLRVVS
jgi:hypothetical protein